MHNLFLKSVHRSAVVAFSLLACASSSRAQEPLTPPAAQQPAPEAAPPAPAPAPPPYSIPWQLRPAAIVKVLRSDSAVAFYENPANGESGTAVASMLLGGYALTPEFSPIVRVGMVSNSPPNGTTTMTGASIDSAVNFLNPVLGGTYMLKPLPDIRVALFLGVAVPIGGGGGDAPDPANALANRSGISTRSAMDNAMFAVDYLTVFPGVDIAWVKHGLTVQGEVTLLELIQVRGDNVAANDKTRTNLTAGLHVGYFLIPELSIGAELRHQRWLSTPTPIKVDEGTLRDTSTAELGVRGHFKVGEKTWIRPGIGFSMPLDNPMADSKYKILHVDVPVLF